MISNIRMLVEELNVARQIAPGDFMFAGNNSEHYFSVGQSALRSILACVSATNEYTDRLGSIEKILDFGCGYGRVCRFLRAAYPAAEISVGDVNGEAVQFCIDTFGCTGIGARPPANSFDLIWVGSVLTHLSETVAKDLLYALADALRPHGVLVFTTHGRYSFATHFCNPDKQSYTPGRMANDRMSASYLSTGFGFTGHSYDSELMSVIDPGVSIIHPRWIHQCFFPCTGLMQIFFQERGWDFHQDIYGFARYELLQSS